MKSYTLRGATYEAGRYGEAVVLREGDVVTSVLFAPITLPVAAVFQHMRGRSTSAR